MQGHPSLAALHGDVIHPVHAASERSEHARVTDTTQNYEFDTGDFPVADK